MFIKHFVLHRDKVIQIWNDMIKGEYMSLVCFKNSKNVEMF